MPNDEHKAGLKPFPIDLQFFAEGDPNPQPGSAGAVPPVPAPNPNPSGATPKTYSEDELNRAKQSASSTAKNEILKELGIASVDEGKSLISAKSDQDKRIAALDAKVKAVEEVANKEHENSVMTSLQCEPKHLDDLRTLAKTRVTADKTFDVSAKEIMDENPQWKGAGALPKPNVGGTKPNPPSGTQKTSEASAAMKSMFPWLK